MHDATTFASERKQNVAARQCAHLSHSQVLNVGGGLSEHHAVRRDGVARGDDNAIFDRGNSFQEGWELRVTVYELLRNGSVNVFESLHQHVAEGLQLCLIQRRQSRHTRMLKLKKLPPASLPPSCPEQINAKASFSKDNKEKKTSPRTVYLAECASSFSKKFRRTFRMGRRTPWRNCKVHGLNCCNAIARVAWAQEAFLRWPR